MSLRDQELLAFRRHDLQPFRGDWRGRSTAKGDRVTPINEADAVITFGDAARHIAVVGATGSGKTLGVMRPALRRLVETGCAGLVVDVKGEYLAIRNEFPDRVMLIGGGKDCTPVNVLSGMPTPVIREWLEQRRARSSEAYWGSTAVDDAILVLLYHRATGADPTLATLIEDLLNPREFVARFDPWLSAQRTLSCELDDAVRNQRNNAFGLLSLGGSALVAYEANRGDSQRAVEQYTWQIQHLLPGVRAAVNDARIRRGLCADRPLDLTKSIYGDRKVLVLDLPDHEFGAAAQTLGHLLRTRYIATVLGYDRHEDESYGVDRFTFLLCDEYQHQLVLSSAGNSRGVYDDTVAFSQTRAKGNICIIATQSVSALRAGRPATEPREAIDCLLANAGTMLAFSSNDRQTAEHVSGRVPRLLRDRTEDLLGAELDRGEALLVSSRLVQHGGGVIASVRTGPLTGYPWMGAYIGAEISDRGRNRYARPLAAELVNPYCESPDLWIATASERFCEARGQLLSAIAEGWEWEFDIPLARVTVRLGRMDADFALRPAADPLRSALQVRGLHLGGRGHALQLPLEPLYRLSLDFPESALADNDRTSSLDERAESGPLALERSVHGGPHLVLLWEAVGRFRLQMDEWRMLEWAAQHYRQLLHDVIAAQAQTEGLQCS